MKWINCTIISTIILKGYFTVKLEEITFSNRQSGVYGSVYNLLFSGIRFHVITTVIIIIIIIIILLPSSSSLCLSFIANLS